MKILFVHQNFPGQFKQLAPELVKHGHAVTALTMQKTDIQEWRGVRVISYSTTRGTTQGIHPWVSDVETKVIRAEACFNAALRLQQQGYTPDIIIAHPGWGESLFLKEIWPTAKLGIYCEFFYHPTGTDVGFDPEFSTNDLRENCRLRLKNTNNLLHFECADAGISPTYWQASTFPEPFRSRISVIHDGIDTDALQPDNNIHLTLNTRQGAITLTRNDEIITFVNRNLEPYRGYHTFMRALPELLRQRPNARVLIVGGNDVSYGARPNPEQYGPAASWKEIFIQEVRPHISDEAWSRVHFLGNLPYEHFIPLLQLSRVHVYLTYPFVLSWSLLEAMSIGCAIVASDTKPLHEAIRHDETGVLVDFFDAPALTNALCELLDDATRRARLGAAARTFAQTHYDLKTVCLPQQLAWIEALAVNH